MNGITLATAEEQNSHKLLQARVARAFGLLAIAGFLFVATLVRPVELRFDEILLFALGFGMALRHTRMLFVSACSRRRSYPGCFVSFRQACVTAANPPC
jgi:hypothetical protein